MDGRVKGVLATGLKGVIGIISGKTVYLRGLLISLMLKPI
jgi:hypothetical protein